MLRDHIFLLETLLAPLDPLRLRSAWQGREPIAIDVTALARLLQAFAGSLRLPATGHDSIVLGGSFVYISSFTSDFKGGNRSLASGIQETDRAVLVIGEKRLSKVQVAGQSARGGN